MRRSASEVIRDLEMRIARLEGKTSDTRTARGIMGLWEFASFVSKSTGYNENKVEEALEDWAKYSEEEFTEGRDPEEDGLLDAMGELEFNVRDFYVNRNRRYTARVHVTNRDGETMSLDMIFTFDGRNVLIEY